MTWMDTSQVFSLFVLFLLNEKKFLPAASYKLLQRSLKSFLPPQMTYYAASSQKISQDD